jgi:anti-sigma factor RsiW
MNCEEARILLHGHLDRELDLKSDLEVERHLAECPQCAREFEAMSAMRTKLGDQSFYFEAPAELKEKIRAALDSAKPRTVKDLLPMRRASSSAMRYALPLAIAAMLAIVILPRALRTPESETVAREVVASHVRSMMGSHLMDVASTDQHTVKPWFNGKLDFSPPVNDFAKQGFPLIGGRLDYLDQRSVAALVYQHGKHVINVFMWPASRDVTSAERIETTQGYNVEQLVVDGMNCWIVSDLNKRELAQFGQLLRSRG